MAFSMAYGTIATDEAIACIGVGAGEVRAPFHRSGFSEEACALPAAPLAMPLQTIEAEAGIIHRMLRRLRPGGQSRTSMDVGA